MLLIAHTLHTVVHWSQYNGHVYTYAFYINLLEPSTVKIDTNLNTFGETLLGYYSENLLKTILEFQV